MQFTFLKHKNIKIKIKKSIINLILILKKLASTVIKYKLYNIKYKLNYKAIKITFNISTFNLIIKKIVIKKRTIIKSLK